jgi:hypothetical protein
MLSEFLAYSGFPPDPDTTVRPFFNLPYGQAVGTSVGQPGDDVERPPMLGTRHPHAQNDAKILDVEWRAF